MMNKKGDSFIGLVLGIFLAIILLIFLTGGGFFKVFEVAGFLKQIPAPAWVVFGIIIMFKLLGGKKR